MKSILFILLVFFQLCISFSMLSQTQEKPVKITVNGFVTDMEGVPLGETIVTIEGEQGLAAANEEGSFSIAVDPNAKLYVSHIGYQPKEVLLEGRSILKIQLDKLSTALSEVVVSSTIKKLMKVTFDPAELELIKDQFFLKTRYRIPNGVYRSDSRLIIQPYIVNVTQGISSSLKPVVLDGTNFDILIKRGMECGDPKEREYYSQFARVVDNITPNDLILYQDSFPVENIQDVYRADILVKINTFCKSEYHDSIVIAKGVVYPLRFLSYKLAAMPMGNEYAPKQEIQSFQEKGDIKLSFLVNDAGIYEHVGGNMRELQKMKNILGEIDQNPSKELKSFWIKGYTSPEGSYEYNLKLAQKRMKNAVESMTRHLSASTLEKVKMKDEAFVEPWTVVYDMMLRDSVAEVADLELLFKRSRGNHNEISWGIKRLKCYPLISGRYLPSLRRVEYYYEYTEFRTLKDEEIQKLYDQDPKKLTANEFWRFINMQPNLSDERKEFYYRQALSVHPSLMIAANELAILKINQNKADTSLLMPFITEDAPLPLLVNQTVSFLQMREFEKASQAALLLPNVPQCAFVKAIAAALNGKYEEAYPVIAAQGGINKAVLLLCMKQNKEAWDTLKDLTDQSAHAEYLRAIAANRLSMMNEALIHFNNALKLDPSLEEIAKKDGDVMDLLEMKE